jgi:hypothetical protein
MGSNIVHQYFKKEVDGIILIVKVNPIQLKGTELSIHPHGGVESRDLEFDEAILEDLKMDGFVESSPLEFNLYQAGLNP